MVPHFALCFEGRVKDELTAAGVAVHLLGKAKVSRPWTIGHVRRRFRLLLHHEKCDAVVCHGCWPHAIFGPVVRSQGLPLVFWAHGVHTGRHWLERWARRTKPDFVLANSRLTQSAIPNFFGNVPSEVLYLPCLDPKIVERVFIRQKVRTSLQTREDATVILQVSRIEPLKGHDLLLNALDQLREKQNWVCWIAGGAQRPQEVAYLDMLKATAARMGIAKQIRFLGQRTDVSELLIAADIYCQPNTGPESFGLTFVEALYAGLPVVTTAIGGALEIVDDRCGVLVPPGDPIALEHALRRLIEDKHLRETLGAAGPNRARSLCDPAKQIKRLHDLLASTVKGGLAA
jgi:glycosyltransferase involved in cell wall biosynthesis